MIKRLVIKDCLGIEELALNPKQMNMITGGNEKGKTTILEAIEKALFNTKRRARFVRTGAEKAYIELETDDGINVRRTIKEDEAGLDKGSVKVTKDNIPVKAPESFLKELFGIAAGRGGDMFAFNPVDFMQKKDTEQTDILLALMPISVTAEQAMAWFHQAPKVDYTKHGLQVLKDLELWFYEARHEANARAKATSDECTAVAKRLPDNYNLDEWSKVNLGQLFSELTAAQATNRDIEEKKKVVGAHELNTGSINNKYDVQVAQAREEERKEFGQVKLKIEEQKLAFMGELNLVIQDIEKTRQHLEYLKTKQTDLDREIRLLETKDLQTSKDALAKLTAQKIEHIDQKRKEEQARLEGTKYAANIFLETYKPIDIAPLRAKCEETERMKSFVPLASEVKSLDDRREQEQKQADSYDKCVETARFKPVELLSKVELPVKSLGIDARGIVTINNLPLSNLSTAQQVKTCLDIARVMAKTSPLKLICVDKAEHLDEDVQREFRKQIEADQEFQYFVTIVTKGDLKVEAK